MKLKNILLLALMACILIIATAQAETQVSPRVVTKEPIRIGGIFSYTGLPDWMSGAQNAAKMAVEEANAAGGLNGRLFEVIIRDDRVDPASAVSVAQDLVERENVSALTGVSFSHVALAISNQAEQMRIPYIASWCWKEDCTQKKEGFTFTLDEHPEQTIDDLAVWAAKQNVTRWAVLIPAMEYGYTSKKFFEEELKKINPKAEIVVSRDYPYGKGDFASIIRLFQKNNVEAVFNAADSSDLAQYLRDARKLGFDNVINVNPYLPYEGLMPLKAEAPKGWFVLGYPGPELKTKEHLDFISKFEKEYKSTPGLTSLISYISTKLTIEAIKKAGSTDPDAIRRALQGLEVQTPIGTVLMDAQTRRSNLGYWYGLTDVKDATPFLKDFYRSGEK